MDLVDSLSSNTTATSPAELSLNPAFRREYTSVYDSIDNFISKSTEKASQSDTEKSVGTDKITSPRTNQSEKSDNTIQTTQEQQQTSLITATIPPLCKRSYHLFATDSTSYPRPFSPTLKDRTFVHHPNPVKGNRPVTIGHEYSVVAYLPEKNQPNDPKWVIPLSARRVSSDNKATSVGAQQIKDILNDKTLPFKEKLNVNTADSAYGVISYLSETGEQDNLINIARMRGNRTVYQSPAIPNKQENRRGHPVWFGDSFSLKDETTWHTPNHSEEMTINISKGNTLILKVQAWDKMLMRGKKDMPMHKRPFRLVRVQRFYQDGQLISNRPLWLIVTGKRRQELSLTDIVEAYMRRYDIEHFFRFGKQKLLMIAYQTPEVEHEENWIQIVLLAYVQLWMARQLANKIPRSWEKYLPVSKADIASPSAVQRDFYRIICQIGTPAKAPKTRNKSSGRKNGQSPGKRNRHSVIKKNKKKPAAT